MDPVCNLCEHVADGKPWQCPKTGRDVLQVCVPMSRRTGEVPAKLRRDLELDECHCPAPHGDHVNDDGEGICKLCGGAQ